MKTPLNYTGNKSRLVEGFKNKFPKNIDVFVDLFCGGGTVGLSVDAKKVFFIDNNEQVIALLQHLSKYKYETLLNRLEQIIKKYNLSYSAKFGYKIYRMGIKKKDNNGLKEYNTNGFYKLRKNYNDQKNKFSKKSLDMLYLLVVYGFNNDLRFNRLKMYNLPIGKTDLNKNNVKKLEDYICRVQKMNCKFVCGDFREERIRNILFSADFVYADPPYLLSDAVYNENGNWTEKEENNLIKLLKELDERSINFALSNILEKRNPKQYNVLLNKWINNKVFKRNDLHVIEVDYHYKSASYNKKNRNAEEREVLIINF